MRDSIHSFAYGENQGSDQCLHWSQQLSTGQLHLDGFESLPNTKKSPTAKAVRDFLAEDEGFEFRGASTFFNQS